MPTGKEIADFIEEASLVANNPAIIPGVSAEEATQVRRIARITVVMADRIAELERAAETTRAEHAAALGLATARIRELEGERDELLDFTRSIASMSYPADIMTWWTREARAIVARIEKAAKGTT